MPSVDISDLSYIKLINLIDKADFRYYRPGFDPIMTDEEYDNLKNKLRELNPNDDRLHRVGIQYSDDELRTKVRHNIPMGSLDNTEDGILGYSDWFNFIKKEIDSDLEIVASLKVDGSSICATYKKGKLIRVATRGNGEVGDNITINAINFIDLPINLPEELDLDVRGEAILYKSDFNYICDRDNISTSDRSNPRNLGNGILGRDDGRDTNMIRFMAFNFEGDIVSTEIEKMNRLKELGFKPVPHKLCRNVSEFTKFYNDVVDNRDKLPFEIDGIVSVVNNISYQNLFVTDDIKTRLRPKYARAIKFPHKSNITQLVDIDLTVGHTRAIIPTAILNEVRVGGVNVTHALLNNWDEISRLDIAIGDTVEVVLAGDIIPKIIRKVKSSGSRKLIIEPKTCPACGSNTTREYRGKLGANTYCVNNNCHASKLAKINHWIGTSKKGVGILGIGDAILKCLWDNNLVKDPSDLYNLTVDKIENLKIDGDIRIGSSRATQIITNINDKRNLSLSVFLGSIGIDLLGKRRADLLIKQANGRLDKLENWLDFDLLSSIDIPGFGDIIRGSIIDGIRENHDLILRLIKSGVVIDGDKNNTVSTINSNTSVKPFNGYSFCLTGTRQYIEDIERLGGVIKSGVSKGLTFLVQADPLSMSNKTKKAEEYGISIISIDYLKQAIDGLVVLSPGNT